MQHHAFPWPAAAFFIVAVIGLGITCLCFADHLCDWQIRMLQSRWYRWTTRGYGVVLIFFGLFFALLFAQHKSG
jgi:threonine/homoserine/homoserine lactone efflux protein